MGQDPTEVTVKRQPVGFAAARAAAMETPRIALAPSLDLLAVPSSSIMRRSSAD